MMGRRCSRRLALWTLVLLCYSSRVVSLVRFIEPNVILSAVILDAFAAYQTATGAIADETTGLLSLTPAQFANLQSLFFTIGGVSITELRKFSSVGR